MGAALSAAAWTTVVTLLCCVGARFLPLVSAVAAHAFGGVLRMAAASALLAFGWAAAFHALEVVHTERAGTLVRGDRRPGQPRGAASITWEEEPGGEYGADRADAGDVTIPVRLELALSRQERLTFENAMHKDYAALVALLEHVAKIVAPSLALRL